MNKILISLLVVLAVMIPTTVFAGTSVSIAGNSHGGYGFSVSHYNGGGYHHYAPRVVHRSRTVVVNRGGYYGGHYPSHHVYAPRARVSHGYYGQPYSYVHRQEGRIYYEDGYVREVIVVPSGGSVCYGRCYPY